MHKKLITACLALVALAAFALPAAAQAANSPVLTHPTGTILGTTTKITATNVTSSTMNPTAGGSAQLTCTNVKMTGEVTTNTTGNVQGTITAAEFNNGSSTSPCTGFFNATVDPLGLGTGAGQGWCLKSTSAMGEDEFQVLGGKCSEAAKKIKFVLTNSAGECEYESTGTTAAKGNYTTDTTGDAILSVPRSGHTPTEDAGFTKIRDTTLFALCPSSSGLQMSLTLETDTNASNDPMYISS